MVVVDRDLEADALDPLLAQLVADPAQDIAADSASVEKTASNKTSRGIDGEPIDPADIVLAREAHGGDDGAVALDDDRARRVLGKPGGHIRRRPAERRGEHPCELSGVGHCRWAEMQFRIGRPVARRSVEHQRVL
ncbi:MAG: hypothetical protein ABSH51_14330 [Solirubrobacteraceae bacterium]